MTISFDALALAPAVVPMLTALVVLVVDVVLPRRARLPWVLAIGGLVGSLAALVIGTNGVFGSGRDHGTTLCEASKGTCFWQVDHAGAGLQGLALATALVVCVMACLERPSAVPSIQSRSAVRAMLLLSATAGCVGVVAARDLGSWLVLVELATIPGVALVALRGGRAAAHGALTLLVTALVSFAVLALGVAVWFAATGTASLTGNEVLEAFRTPSHKPLVIVAMMLVVAGIGFKLSLAPFHAWTPEAFDGSGAWVAAFLATTSKVGALGGMLVIVRAASTLGSSALTALAIAAAVSMTVGNVMALRERSALRLMAWSTVSQAGWVVLPMTVVSHGSIGAAASYLALYATGTLAVFVVLAALEGTCGAPVTRESLRGLFRTHPVLAGTMALGLLALAGVPPSIVGVVAKIVALKPVVSGDVWWLVLVAVLNGVIGFAVYLRWVLAMFQPADALDDSSADLSDAAASVPMPGTPARGYGVLAGLVACGLVVTSIAPALLLAAF